MSEAKPAMSANVTLFFAPLASFRFSLEIGGPSDPKRDLTLDLTVFNLNEARVQPLTMYVQVPISFGNIRRRG